MNQFFTFLAGLIVGYIVAKRVITAAVVSDTKTAAEKIEATADADAKAALAAIEADAKKL